LAEGRFVALTQLLSAEDLQTAARSCRHALKAASLMRFWRRAPLISSNFGN
jgi:hypothetical protein